jgi:hypothetical protein
MTTRYLVCVDDEPVGQPYDILELAKALGREHSQSGAVSVRIDIYPPDPTIPMSALTFDPDLEDWIAASLP